MRLNKIALLAASLAMISAGPSFAEQGIGRGPHEFSDKDAHVHMSDTMRKHFDHADQNGDGRVTRSEMDAHMQAAQSASEYLDSWTDPTTGHHSVSIPGPTGHYGR